MADEEEQMIPPPAVFTYIEKQNQQREQQDVNRLRRLPPQEYDRMDRDQRLAFIQWYQQTAECRKMSETHPKDSLECIFAAYPTQEPADTRLKESLAESFKLYLQQTWSSEGKQPPQPSSCFLFHKRFSRLIDQGIYLTTHMDMILTLLFSLQEVEQINTQGLESIITAVGSNELHFHELGTLYPNDKETLYIYLRQNARYFLSANIEFMKQETTEVWFRRAKEGIPQFIFCPTVSAIFPQLSHPLSTPGEPEVVLELSRLEAMPALHLERCGPEHKDDFYEWLLTKDNIHLRDEDPESLELVACLIKSGSDDFKVAHLYEKYVQDRWSMPFKHLPEPQSVYLYQKKFQQADSFWITFPLELMQQALSLVLNTEEFDKLFKSKVLFVNVSLSTSAHSKMEKQGLLEIVETICKISCFIEGYDDIFNQLISEVDFEVWFVRTQNKPKFIIRSQQERS